MATITLNWRILRPLLIFLFFSLCSVFYIYHAYRPPTTLYMELVKSELELSRKLIHNERGKKYVKFKQLQGAGFNNQVRNLFLSPMAQHLIVVYRRKRFYYTTTWLCKLHASMSTNHLSGAHEERKQRYHCQPFFVVQPNARSVMQYSMRSALLKKSRMSNLESITWSNGTMQ